MLSGRLAQHDVDQSLEALLLGDAHAGLGLGLAEVHVQLDGLVLDGHGEVEIGGVVELARVELVEALVDGGHEALDRVATQAKHLDAHVRWEFDGGRALDEAVGAAASEQLGLGREDALRGVLGHWDGLPAELARAGANLAAVLFVLEGIGVAALVHR